MNDDSSRPYLLLGMSVFLVATLLIVSNLLSDDDETGPNGQPIRGPGSVSMVPGAPVSGISSPEGDHPSVTIVNDVREIMHRLPDRNTPPGMEPRPKPTKGPLRARPGK